MGALVGIVMVVLVAIMLVALIAIVLKCTNSNSNNSNFKPMPGQYTQNGYISQSGVLHKRY